MISKILNKACDPIKCTYMFDHIPWKLELISFTFAVSWLQVDKGIGSEIVHSILAERANWPCLAAKSSYEVSNSSFYIWMALVIHVIVARSNSSSIYLPPWQVLLIYFAMDDLSFLALPLCVFR